MLPRQCRTRGCTGSARRKSMRPWQRPDAVFTATTATELPVPGVTAAGPSGLRAAPARPRGRGGAGAARKQRRYPAIVGPLARPSPDRRYSAILSKRHPARMSCRAPLADPSTHSPGGGPHLPDRSTARGEWSGGFPQPTESSAAGRPTRYPDKRSADRRARAHGRAHGHTPGARRTPARASPCGRPGPPARTTIPPSGRLPLNGRDRENYAVFTGVLNRGHIPRGSATCVCRRSTEVRTWGGIGTNAARRPR